MVSVRTPQMAVAQAIPGQMPGGFHDKSDLSGHRDGRRVIIEQSGAICANSSCPA
jgi:hypothetical protein